MKKIIIGILLVLIVSVGAVYLLIPSEIKVSKIGVIAGTDYDVTNFFGDSTTWNRWWPKDFIIGKTNSFAFSVKKMGENNVDITVLNKKNSLSSKVELLILKRDSTAFQWSVTMPKTNNPIERINNYIEAVKLKEDFTKITESLKSYFANEENIYGFMVERTAMTDTVMISKRKVYNHYPSTDEIYELINDLRLFANTATTKITNAPMLHIEEEDSTHYSAMVALPIEKVIPVTGDISIKRMILGKTLKATVTGGVGKINSSLQQLLKYKNDHGFISPAIPFQSLITNRMLETDSSKWVTKLYYPVL